MSRPLRTLNLYCNPLSRSFVFSRRALCPDCAFARLFKCSQWQNKSRQTPPRQRRLQHSYASATAINASKAIPPQFRELYTALQRLQKHAENYVDLSRLRLALRSLESSEPVIRTAVFGLGDQRSARSLARLLCADALDVEAEWEKQLEALPPDDQRSIILRYGPEAYAPESNQLVTTLNVPSRTLKNSNQELLIVTLPEHGAAPASSSSQTYRDMLFTPMLETVRSFGGNVSFIRYPVHRALLVADGLSGCLSLGLWAANMASKTTLSYSNARLTANLPQTPCKDDDASAEGLTVIDIDSAAHALEKFRESKENVPEYEQGWSDSHLSAISEWLMSDAREPPNGMAVVVKDLISELLELTSKNILEEDSTMLNDMTSSQSVRQNKVQILTTSMNRWAQQGHTELRDRLDSLLQSKSWAKTKWWKLLWRVDDVDMLLTDLLERSWLVDAEKGVNWLAGQSTGAGILDTRPIESNDAYSGHATLHDSSARAATEQHTYWYLRIPDERKKIINASIPYLQRQAQSLVIQAMTLSSIGGSISLVSYLSFPSFTVYEAGALAALSLSWALLKLQKGWEGARIEWIQQLRERGRRALRDTQEQFKTAITNEMDVGNESFSSTEARRLARSAIEEVSKALEEAGQK